LVTGREDELPDGRWNVQSGWALRGHASCNFVTRTIEVPLGSTPTDRVIRAHELIHLRVSPHDVHPLSVYRDLHQRALECAEEYRVNLLLGRMGFDVALVRDGSESIAAQRLALNGAWDEAVFFFTATISTGAEREFLKGLRRVSPEWVKALQLVRRRIVTMFAKWSVDAIASTHRADSLELPQGFDSFTVPLARLLMNVANAATPTSANELRQFRRSLEPGGRRAPSGRFADLIVDDSMIYDAVVQRASSRRIRADVSGTALRFPSRLLTDPHQRAFSRKKRAPGGVVVVDQSGSMDVDVSQIDDLLRATPDAVVIGYSHRPGDISHSANVWTIAHEGRRARTIPHGNVGNGVDGPVLRYAISRRKRGDRVIWVTDGQVTDSNDHPSVQLSSECAQLVQRHRITMVRTVDDAVALLRCGHGFRHESPANFGRVGAAWASLDV
jgi:hypothetical protein